MVQGSVPLLLSDLLIYVTTGVLAVTCGEFLITDQFALIFVVSEAGLPGILFAIITCYAVGFVFLSFREWLLTLLSIVDEKLVRLARVRYATHRRKGQWAASSLRTKILLSVKRHGFFGSMLHLLDLQFSRQSKNSSELLDLADQTHTRLVQSLLDRENIPHKIRDSVECAIIRMDQDSSSYFYRLGTLSTFGDSLAFLAILFSLASVVKAVASDSFGIWLAVSGIALLVSIVVWGQAHRLDRFVRAERCFYGIADRLS